MRKIFLASIALCSLTLMTSCGKEELKRENFDNKGNQESTVSSTQKYEFKRNGYSSVDIKASVAPIEAFRVFNLGLNPKNKLGFEVKEEQLEKFKFLIAKSQTEQEQEIIARHFNSLIEQFKAANSNNHNVAAEGKPGVITLTNTEGLLVDGKGVELGQVIQKALMGSMQIDQIYYHLNKSISEETLNEVSVEGKNFTDKEHEWDTAYGMLGRNDISTTPIRTEPMFLANYIEKEVVGMPSLKDIDNKIFSAFYEGRKAITENNMDIANQKANEIKKLIDKLVIERTKYYLRESMKNLLNSPSDINENYYHSMGEALGFILCIPFTSTKALSYEAAIQMYNRLIGSENIGIRDKSRLTTISDQTSIPAVISELSKLTNG